MYSRNVGERNKPIRCVYFRVTVSTSSIIGGRKVYTRTENRLEVKISEDDPPPPKGTHIYKGDLVVMKGRTYCRGYVVEKLSEVCRFLYHRSG